MRAAVMGVLLSLAIPASAFARAPVRTIAPPGVSGVSQYVEDIPTAKGNRPSASVVPAGGGNGPSSSSGSSALTSSTQQALDKQGSAGRQAGALADETAPATASHAPRVSHASSESAASADTVTPPTAAVLKAMTGSAAHGGLGALLPVLLVLILLGGGVLAMRRRRGDDAKPDSEA